MIDLQKVFDGSMEHNTLEVKAAQGGIPKSIWETYSAFANTFGGTIILGIGEDKVTKKFVPLGVADAEKMCSDIWNTVNNPQKINSNILMERHIYVQTYEGREYVIIDVPRASRQDKPIYLGSDMFKGSYRRNHEGDYRCTDAEVKAMIRDQSDTSADSTVLDNVDLDALNRDSIKSYRSRFELIRSEHTWNALPTEEFLIKIGAARLSDVDHKIHPTLGGLIFFGDFINIMNELPNFFLDYREKLAADTRWSDRVCSGDGDWSGNVYDFYFKIIDRLTSDVKKPFVLNAALLREDDTVIHKALREALANTLIHADYQGRQGIVIEKEFRKVSFANPGTFRIDIAEAIAGGISDARNTRIFNMFSLIKVGERSGTGLCDIYNLWDKVGFEKPIIAETVSPDRVVLTLQIETTNAQNGANGKNGANVGANDENDANVGANGKNGANRIVKSAVRIKNEQAILAYLAQYPETTTQAIANTLTLSPRSVQRYMTDLQKENIIRNDGTRKKSSWVILQKT